MALLIFGLLLASIGVAVLFPHLPCGKACRRVLIEAPARWLNAGSPVRLAVAIGVMLFLCLAPEMAFVAGDLALYVDVLIAASLVAVNLRARDLVKAVVEVVTRTASRMTARAKPRSVRAPRRPPPASNNDGEPWGLVLAAA